MILRELKTLRLFCLGLACCGVYLAFVVPSWSQNGDLDDLFSDDEAVPVEANDDLALGDDALFDDGQVAPPAESSDDLFSDTTDRVARDPRRNGVTQTITLERTTYRLPSHKARLFNDFLRQAVHEDAASVRLRPGQQRGNQNELLLVITATPESQKAIRQFVAFLRAAPAPQSEALTESPPEIFGDFAVPVETH